MLFSSITTLFSVASLAHAAPSIHAHKRAHLSHRSSAQYQSGTFYVNWAIYGRQHFVTDLPADKFTKINYAFANVNNSTGEVFLTDEWSDLQYQYPGDVASNGTELYGNFKQLYKLKQQNPYLRIMLSVGGWSYRANFKPGLATPDRRHRFCESAVTLIADLGLDGLDIDWEYPEDETDADNFVDTVKICRRLFDEYADEYAPGYHFGLGISAPAGPQRYNVMPVAEMDPYIDNWNLMAFDYQGGGFSNYTGHLSNVYADESNPKTTDGWVTEINGTVPFNTAQAVDYYKANIASPDKLHLGLALYGRSFAHVVDLSKDQRGLGQRFNGSGEGTWEPGALDWKDLPQNGSKVYTDDDVLASWSWDPVKRQFVSFDTLRVFRWKVDYLKKEGLGGAWFWESSGDVEITDDGSAVATVVKELGGTDNFKLEQNNLYYPISRYDNIRNAANATAASA